VEALENPTNAAFEDQHLLNGGEGCLDACHITNDTNQGLTEGGQRPTNLFVPKGQGFLHGAAGRRRCREEAAPPGLGQLRRDFLLQGIYVAVQDFSGCDQEARLAKLEPVAKKRSSNPKATFFRFEVRGQVRPCLHHHIGQLC